MDHLTKILEAAKTGAIFPSKDDLRWFYQLLADNAPVMAWVTDSDLKPVYFNKRWLEFTGNDFNAQNSSPWMVGMHPDDEQLSRELIADCIKSGCDNRIEYRLLRHDGSYRWLVEHGCPLYGVDRKIIGYLGLAMDITESKEAMLELEGQGSLIKTLTDNSLHGLFLLNDAGECTFANPAAERLIGYTAAEMYGQSFHDLVHHTRPDGSTFPAAECPLTRALHDRAPLSGYEGYFVRKGGGFFPLLASTSPLFRAGKFTGMILEVADITELKRTESLIKQNEERFRTLIEKSSDVVIMVDQAGQPKYVSPAIHNVLGYTVAEAMRFNCFDLVHPEDMGLALREFKGMLIDPTRSNLLELRAKHRDGSWHWLEVVGTNLLANEKINAAVINFRDITSRKRMEQRLQHHFFHDTLTDLPNRNYFTERLNELVNSAGDRPFGTIVLDLDRFKVINDSLGHAIGDRLIQDVSLRLATCLDDTDMLARLGGDEFGMVIPRMDREEQVGAVCQKVLECLKAPFTFEGHEFYVTPSMGVSIYPFDGRDAQSLLKNADAALYRAKELGRNNFQYYTPVMNAKVFQQLALESTMRRALTNNEFLVYFIPQVDLASGEIVQVEALIRWMHPELGLTFPDEFISIAETTGMIQAIGEWVLRTACAEVKKWNDAGHNIGLSVNLSARQVRQRHFTRNIKRVLTETGFDPRRLEFELTESVLVDNSQALYNSMLQLSRFGVRFAIDDFTTGHSSLSYIKRFPVHSLKVSHSFMKGIPFNEKDTAIANAVINLSRSLNLIVTAEGVERRDQMQFLRERGCHKAQGYLISPPLDSAGMLALLKKQRRWLE